MGNRARKNSLSCFFMMTVLFSLLLLLLHIVIPEAGIYSISFTQLSPAFAVMAMAIILKDQKMMKNIRKKFFLSKTILIWMIPAITIPLLLIAASSMILNLFEVPYVPWKGSFSFYAVSTTAMLIGCTAEEIGWRGFLLPGLMKKHTPFVSSIIVGVLWGVWHLNFTGGLIGFLLYVITIIEMSVLMSWLHIHTSGNLYLMTLWHLTINLTSHLLLWERFGTKLFIAESAVFGMACMILAVMEKDTYFFSRTLNNQDPERTEMKTYQNVAQEENSTDELLKNLK